MNMNRVWLQAAVLAGLFSAFVAPPVWAQDFSKTVIFYDAGFPSADTAAASREQLSAALPNAGLTSADELAAALDATAARLLILP
jgi:hypothetical protein